MKNEKGVRLSALKEGESACVAALNNGDEMRRRLIDLGLVSGTRVKCVQKSPSGDICAYCIRGAIIALRCEDAGEVICARGVEKA